MNEYCCRHLLQNPASRPGRSSLLRPTSVPQLPQNRLSSATIGSAIMAVEGSSMGIGGTLTSPAPMRLRELLPRTVDVVRLDGDVGDPLGREPVIPEVSEEPAVPWVGEVHLRPGSGFSRAVGCGGPRSAGCVGCCLCQSRRRSRPPPLPWSCRQLRPPGRCCQG